VSPARLSHGLTPLRAPAEVKIVSLALSPAEGGDDDDDDDAWGEFEVVEEEGEDWDT
jgi:hypothetical protein